MRIIFLPFLFLLLPFALLAQDAAAVYTDFYKGIKDIKSMVLDDHVNIMQVNTDNEKFEVVAVNDQIQVLWRSTFAGYAFSISKFQGNIVAVASASDYQSIKGNSNTYKAFLIDPVNGKLLMEKIIYQGNNDYMEYPYVFNSEGAHFKLAIRTTGSERMSHVGFSLGKYNGDLNETRELHVITINDKLDTVSNVKLPLSTGRMQYWCTNKQADLFIAWLNGPTIEVYKYPDGSKTPVQQLNADVTFKMDKNNAPSDMLRLLPSTTNNNVIYYGVSYLNANNDAELGIGRFDFATGKKTFVTESFDNDHLKSLQKSFVPVNKKLDGANLGPHNDLRIRSLIEVSGTLIATLTARYSEPGRYGSWAIENAVLINGYNDDLSTKFQQILPISFSLSSIWLESGYHFTKNKLYVVGNNQSGMTMQTAVFGSLDVSTGKWDKMDILLKKKISNSAYVNGAVLWFADTYVVPYFSPKGMTQSKYDISLQQNNY